MGSLVGYEQNNGGSGALLTAQARESSLAQEAIARAGLQSHRRP
jgi:hypothetical protein